VLKNSGHDIKTGYLYFSKVYFTTLLFALLIGLLVHITVERPILKLADSNRVVPKSILLDDRLEYMPTPTSEEGAAAAAAAEEGEDDRTVGSYSSASVNSTSTTKSRPAPVKSKAKKTAGSK
jgi:hypothetical protein